eukprot:7927934-Pyramimonas_sp.AAC.1
MTGFGNQLPKMLDFGNQLPKRHGFGNQLPKLELSRGPVAKGGKAASCQKEDTLGDVVAMRGSIRVTSCQRGRGWGIPWGTPSSIKRQH